jgi:glutathione S-transferase
MAKHEFVLPERFRVPAVRDTARWEFANVSDVLATHLGEHEYILGDRFTVADILVGHTLSWARSTDIVLKPKSIRNYADRVLARAALARAHERERAYT